MNLSKMAALTKSSCSSVDRAPARCYGGHGFKLVKMQRHGTLFKIFKIREFSMVFSKPY